MRRWYTRGGDRRRRNATLACSWFERQFSGVASWAPAHHISRTGIHLWSLPTPELMTGPRFATSTSSAASTSRKRGHHHKHSLLHNFFSFLEPGTNGAFFSEEELHIQPMPVSPRSPISAIPPDSSALSTSGFDLQVPKNGHAEPQHIPSPQQPWLDRSSRTQFVPPAWLWVTGHQLGSLVSTGLVTRWCSTHLASRSRHRYWLASGPASRLAKEKRKIRRSYGCVLWMALLLK